nr:hypothetical protein [Thiothrix fructosivorans]
MIMSGGYFDYKQAYLGYIADQLERDIAYNAIPYDGAIVEDGEKYYGHQLQPQTIEFMSCPPNALRNGRSRFSRLGFCHPAGSRGGTVTTDPVTASTGCFDATTRQLSCVIWVISWHSTTSVEEGIFRDALKTVCGCCKQP